MRLTPLLPSLMLAAPLAAPLGAQGREQLAAGIDSIAGAALREGPIAGMSIAVLRGGDTITLKGYGFANLEHRVPASAKTVYHIASITKNFTAAAILRLQQAGKLTLGEDIQRLVPQFQTRTRRVTIAELLNHTSGIRDYTQMPGFEGERDRLELPHDAIVATIANQPYDFEPGTSWRYDNSGYFLLGLMIERASGVSYGSYVGDSIASPLGLRDTRYCEDRPIIADRAQGYHVKQSASGSALVNADPINWNSAFSAGGMCSTALDLLRWEAALDAARVLNSATLAIMRAPTRLRGDAPLDYGYGTALGEIAGHRMLGHAGSGAGFTSVLLRLPDDDITIVVLANSDSRANARVIGARIVRLILNAPQRQTLTADPPARLARYVGVYDTQLGRLETYVAVDGLHARPPGTRDTGLLMQRIAEDTFRIGDDDEIRFVIDRGRGTWAIEYQGGLLSWAGRRK
ncbi:MAG: beta-lactamase family protein [Gemmatimonadota bacterium]|nr:beta-lactamase family protein [Gemmatimonadota bacterium]